MDNEERETLLEAVEDLAVIVRILNNLDERLAFLEQQLADARRIVQHLTTE